MVRVVTLWTFPVPVDKNGHQSLENMAYTHVHQIVGERPPAFGRGPSALGRRELMAYTLSPDVRLSVIHALCEGTSINATGRQTGPGR